MKKLTAGIFTVMLGLCATSGAEAAVASKGYVDTKVGANTTAITDLTQTVADNKSAAETAIADAKKAGTDAAAALETYKGTNDAAVKANADAIAAAEQDIVALETTVNDETNGLVAKVATLQQDIANVQGGSLTLQDKSISKAKLDESLQAEINSFQDADEVSGAIETALGDYTTTTDLDAALALKGDKTAVEANAANIATNTGAIATLNGDASTAGSVAKSIADAFTAANLSQYATTEAMNPFFTSNTLKSAFASSAKIASISSLDVIFTLPFSSPWYFAINGFFSPGILSFASNDQYSSGMNALISSSRSQIIRNATDCTRPALSPRFTFAHKSGLIL